MTKIRLMKKGRADNQTRGDSVLKMDGFISNTSEHIDYPQKTMYRLIAETSEKYPEWNAYTFYNKAAAYKQFNNDICRVSRAFAKTGLKEGDAVTLCLPNIPQTLEAFYALNRNGLVANMIHPLSAQSEIVFYLNMAKSPMIITVDMFYEKVMAAAKEADHPVEVIVVRIQDKLPFFYKILYEIKAGHKYKKYPDDKNARLWKDFLAEGDSLPLPEEEPFDETRTSVILYSGGTSGTPKGICISDLNMNALAYQCREMIPYEIVPGLTMLSCMPMFHGFGLGVNIHTVLAFGACCILMPTFNTRTYANALLKHRPNFIAGVPTIFDALLHMPQLEGKDLSFLKGMFCGGDSLLPDLKKRLDLFLKEHGASIQVQEGYGLTECVTASCLTPAREYREGSIGLPFADTSYAIVKPGTDELLPPDTEGEIILSGPTVMLGYLDNEEENAKTLRRLDDGNIWLYTGDLGAIDKEGFVYFRQRLKRMIVTNGYNVYPSVMEDILSKCPGVSSCCIVGKKDQRRGQIVTAYIIPDDENADQEQLKQDIMDYLKLHVAAYALPREIHFKSDLPKTLVGKVAFRVLEDEANGTAAAM